MMSPDSGRIHGSGRHHHDPGQRNDGPSRNRRPARRTADVGRRCAERDDRRRACTASPSSAHLASRENEPRRTHQGSGDAAPSTCGPRGSKPRARGVGQTAPHRRGAQPPRRCPERVGCATRQAHAHPGGSRDAGRARRQAGLRRRSAALESVREITLAVPALLLARSGLLDALRAHVTRAPVGVRLQGTAPRSTEEAEVALYSACLEAIQNVAKHAGRDAHVTFRLHHSHGNLWVRIGDDGLGFDPAQTPASAGLRNIHDRVHAMGGSVKLISTPGRGTLPTLSLPRPPQHPDSRPRARAQTAGAPGALIHPIGPHE
jgi:hypothetical protein